MMSEIAGNEIVQLKNNIIPKGLVPLERLFDEDDVARKPSLVPDEEEVELCNLGTEEEPKNIKMAKALPQDIKGKYTLLFKEFRDVFAWRYEYLKECDTNIIQHIIPIKEKEKLFK